MPEATNTTCDKVTRRAGFPDGCGNGAAFRFFCFKLGWNDTYVCLNNNSGRGS